VSIDRWSYRYVTESRAWGASLWYWRLRFVYSPLDVCGLILVFAFHRSVAFILVSGFATGVLTVCRRNALRRSGIELKRPRWTLSRWAVVIADDALRRQYRRDLFWLPRR
jgi:hypothetical protein